LALKGGFTPETMSPGLSGVPVRTRRFERLRRQSSANKRSPSDLEVGIEKPNGKGLGFVQRYEGPRPRRWYLVQIPLHVFATSAN